PSSSQCRHRHRKKTVVPTELPGPGSTGSSGSTFTSCVADALARIDTSFSCLSKSPESETVPGFSELEPTPEPPESAPEPPGQIIKSPVLPEAPESAPVSAPAETSPPAAEVSTSAVAAESSEPEPAPEPIEPEPASEPTESEPASEPSEPEPEPEPSEPEPAPEPTEPLGQIVKSPVCLRLLKSPCQPVLSSHHQLQLFRKQQLVQKDLKNITVGYTVCIQKLRGHIKFTCKVKCILGSS
ncbi:protein TsetseEP-like, partial [Austrofundulus limnaeus]|uniref:Protein TsetseEP-like n=1 Tax=Austrofundulus limnaeus TaxID=52670 RepID=A0A2I4AHU1_AUSLI